MKNSDNYPPGRYPNGEYPAYGEVYLCERPDPQGGEMQKRRPWVVVSNDALNRRRDVHTMAALSRSKHSPSIRDIVDFNGKLPLLDPGSIKTGQLFTFDRSRIGKYQDRLSDQVMQNVAVALGFAVNTRRR